MSKNEKKMILVLLIILVIAIIIFAVSKNKESNNDNNNEEVVQNDSVEEIIEENNIIEEFTQVFDNGTKLNTSTKLNEAKEVNGLRFENIQLTEQNGQSLLLADVTNNSGKAVDMTIFDITLIDKNGNEIVTLGGIISALQPGESTQFNTSTTLDYANAYDFKITIK